MLSSRASRFVRQMAPSLQRASQRRNMGGGDRPPFTISEAHTNGGIVMGFVCWMWIFYRAKHDLPVVLGLRHPWDHDHDDDHHDDHAEDEHFAYLHSTWDKHAVDTMKLSDDDDDDDDDDDEEEDEE